MANMENCIKTGMEFSVDVAWQAGKIIMRYYGTDISPDLKNDNSPVTVADREAEQLIRDMILKSFPCFGFDQKSYENRLVKT